jgi:hypothetical protein
VLLDDGDGGRGTMSEGVRCGSSYSSTFGWTGSVVTLP